MAEKKEESDSYECSNCGYGASDTAAKEICPVCRTNNSFKKKREKEAKKRKTV